MSQTDIRRTVSDGLDFVWRDLCSIFDEAVSERDLPLTMALGELCSTFAKARDSLGPRMQVITDEIERARR